MPGNHFGSVMAGASWIILANALSTILKFLVIPLLARLLTPEDFGVVAISMSVILFFSYLGGRGGLSAAVIAVPNSTLTTWYSAFTTNVLIGLSACAGLIYFASDIAQFLRAPSATEYLRVLALLIPIQFAVDVYSSNLISLNKFKYESLIATLADIISSIVVLVAAVSGFGVWALILQHFFAQIIRLIGFHLIAQEKMRLILSLNELKKLYKYSFVSFWTEIANFIAFQSPSVIASKFIGLPSSGAISITNRLSSLPGDIIQQAISKTLFPIFSSLTKKQIDTTRMLLWSSWINTLLMAPMLFGLAALAEPATSLILGSQYVPYWEVLAYLAISKAIMTPCSSFNSFLKGIGRVNTLLGLLTIRALTVIIMGIWLAQEYGVVGLSIAITIASVFSHFIYIYTVLSVAKINIILGVKSYFSPFVLSLLMYFIVKFLYSITSQHLIGGVCFSVFCGMVFYVVAIVFLYKGARSIRSIDDLKSFISTYPYEAKGE